MTARIILGSVLLTILSYIGCENTNSENNKHITEDNSLKKQWYRCYSGTIDGMPAVVNLQCAGKIVHGSYYYTNKGIITDLIYAGQNDGRSGNITFTENDPEQGSQGDSSGKDSWQLNIQDGIATGKWISGDKQRSAGINLKEAYPAGTYPLNVIVEGNSKEERKEVLHITAATFYELVQPTAAMDKADADFLNRSILHFLGGGTGQEQNINDYVLLEDKKYFDNFEKLLADMKIDREAHEDWEYNFEHTKRLNVLYNSNGMLVLQLASSERTGGGIMGSHFRNVYACIDVRGKRQWQLSDIMEVDAAKLTPLLNAEAQRISQQPNSLLAGKLRAGDIPLTDNYYVTGTGVAFCYFPGVIAPEEIGEICLFIPYDQLAPQLKIDFRKRMAI